MHTHVYGKTITCISVCFTLRHLGQKKKSAPIAKSNFSHSVIFGWSPPPPPMCTPSWTHHTVQSGYWLFSEKVIAATELWSSTVHSIIYLWWSPTTPYINIISPRRHSLWPKLFQGPSSHSSWICGFKPNFRTELGGGEGWWLFNGWRQARFPNRARVGGKGWLLATIATILSQNHYLAIGQVWWIGHPGPLEHPSHSIRKESSVSNIF